jgi:hypothetical protein
MWTDTVTSWLAALKLPGKVVFGMFLFCAALLLLNFFGVVPLSALGPFGWTLVLVALLLFGCLSIGAASSEGYEVWKRHRAEKKVRARQQAKREEHEEARDKCRAEVLKRLDYLSRKEHRVLADQLRKNERSFEGWAYSSAVSNLMAAGLVGSPGGRAHQDYYPYYVVDFVWDALLERREQFLAKDDDNRRREADEKRARESR